MIADESILSVAQKIKTKEVSSEEVWAECWAQIQKFNPSLNALITPVEPKPSEKSTSSLWSIPYVLKDCYSTKGIRTTCASKVLANYVPPFDATVVTKLKKAGAVLVGKANLDAWGHGGSSENTDFGPVHNPWNLERVAGGSSGGPAAAIVSRMCLFAIGEDTGGSIRNPAGWCNITGLKVTYGRVSRYGTIAYASSFDTVGPMAKTAEDCAVVLEIIAGKDPYDATSSSDTRVNYLSEITKDIKGVRLGLPKEFFEEGIDKEVKELVLLAVKKFEDLGVKIVDVSLPSLKYAVATYYLLAPAETSSNLARYDGIRFGQARENFTEETMRRIMMGTYALSAGYYDAYYKKAQQARTLMIHDYQKVFNQCEAVLAPIMPTPPPKIGELLDDPVKNWLADIYTVTLNPAGLPALALPCGFTKDELPIGMQIQGKAFEEALLLRLGHAYQQVTDWHKRKPKL
jgi:aspartyl-tRNA(Asn)/glutamyl-tRNA(Gln) amidotransferase subunit A